MTEYLLSPAGEKFEIPGEDQDAGEFKLTKKRQ